MRYFLIRLICLSAAAGTVVFLGSRVPASAQSAQIQYISSSTRYVLFRSGSTAVAADWNGQPPISNFSGYGQIQQDGQCLAATTGGQPLTWQRCRSSSVNQRWSLERGRLRNESGWCADLEGNRNGPGVPVVAWNCTGAVNQRWRPHYAVNAAPILNQISDAAIRNSLQAKIQNTSAGRPIALSPAEASALRSFPVGGQLIAAGSMNLIAAGGMNLIAAGSMN